MNQKKARRIRKENGIKRDTSKYNFSEEQKVMIRERREELERRRLVRKSLKPTREKTGWRVFGKGPEVESEKV